MEIQSIKDYDKFQENLFNNSYELFKQLAKQNNISKERSRKNFLESNQKERENVIKYLEFIQENKSVNHKGILTTTKRKYIKIEIEDNRPIILFTENRSKKIYFEKI